MTWCSFKIRPAYVHYNYLSLPLQFCCPVTTNRQKHYYRAIAVKVLRQDKILDLKTVWVVNSNG